MATMFPNRLADATTGDPKRAAEVAVYEALRAQLGEEYVVFYSVAWLSKSPNGGAPDGETDFVLLHPQKGVLVIEVKGGTIGHDGASDTWTSTDRFGQRHVIHNPF